MYKHNRLAFDSIIFYYFLLPTKEKSNKFMKNSQIFPYIYIYYFRYNIINSFISELKIRLIDILQ